MVTETKDKKILKLGNWQMFLLGKLHELYLKKEQCNITLKFDNGETIQAHRLVLGACTTFFDHLPQVHQPVVLHMPPTLQLQHVKSIVSFMYTGRLEYEAQEQDDIFSTAKKLGMSVITEMMQAQIKEKILSTTKKKKEVPVKMYKKIVHKNMPLSSELSTPTSELDPEPPSPSTPQGTPLSSLPGKKLPFWKKRSVISLPEEFYRNTVQKKPPPPKADEDPPMPTRFEWPENTSMSEAKLAALSMTCDSFENLSYNSRVDLQPLSTTKPVVSEGSISKMPETSLSGTKRGRSSEVLRGYSCEDEDYDDGHFEDIHDIGDDSEDVTQPQPVSTPPRPILKTVSTPTPSKKVRFSFSHDDEDLTLSSMGDTRAASSSSGTSHSTSVITSTPAVQSTSTVSPATTTNSNPIIISDSPTTKNITPKVISESSTTTTNITPKIVSESCNSTTNITPKVSVSESSITPSNIYPKIIIDSPTTPSNNYHKIISDSPTTPSNNLTKIISDSPNMTPNINPKIISEILKKYPALAKGNKNIKLKIQPGPSGLGSNQSGFSEKDGKVQKTIQYIVMKQDPDFVRSEERPQVVMGAENRTGPWFCVACGSKEEPKNFDTYYNYRRHLQDVHNERIDARICEHCGYKASKRNLHLYHLYTKHDIPPPRNINFPKCDQCSYIALSESLLIKHRSNHTGMATSEYVCRLCNAAFKSNGALMGHMQTNLHLVDQAAKKDYKCSFCSKVFHRNINLKAHVRTCHQLESIRRMYDDEDRIDESPGEEDDKIEQFKEEDVKKPQPHKVPAKIANVPKKQSGQKTLQQQSNENVMEVIEMPVYNSVAGANKTLFIPHSGMTILAESPSVPLMPSSESEALTNVATGIATSINIAERNISNDVIVIDGPGSELILQRTPATYVLNQDGSYSVQEYIVPEMINDSGRVYTTTLVSSAPATGITYVNTDNISIISASDHTYADGMKINGAQVSLVASCAPTVIATSQANQPIIVHSEPIIMNQEWVQAINVPQPPQQVEIISGSVNYGQRAESQGCPRIAQNLVNDWGDLEEEEEEEACEDGDDEDEVKPSRLSVNVLCPMDEHALE